MLELVHALYSCSPDRYVVIGPTGIGHAGALDDALLYTVSVSKQAQG